MVLAREEFLADWLTPWGQILTEDGPVFSLWLSPVKSRRPTRVTGEFKAELELARTDALWLLTVWGYVQNLEDLHNIVCYLRLPTRQQTWPDKRGYRQTQRECAGFAKLWLWDHEQRVCGSLDGG